MKKIIIIASIFLLAASCSGQPVNQTGVQQTPLGQNNSEKKAATKKRQEQPTNSKKAEVKTYKSEKLGISFNYLSQDPRYDTETKVIERGDTVIVTTVLGPNRADEGGQYVKIFKKNKEQTFKQAISSQLLKNYSQCVIKTDTSFTSINPLPNDYLAAAVRSKKLDSSNFDPKDYLKYSDDCPSGYSNVGSIAFFLMDSKHPDKFAFFSIGQYSIAGNDKNQEWQDTFRFN